MILFHFRWWVRVALKRKVATGTNINPIHCSTFHVKYLHGIPWSIHGVFVEVFYMGYHGGQFPVDKALQILLFTNFDS